MSVMLYGGHIQVGWGKSYQHDNMTMFISKFVSVGEMQYLCIVVMGEQRAWGLTWSRESILQPALWCT